MATLANLRKDFTQYDEEREHSMADEGGMSGAQCEGEPALRLLPPSFPPRAERKKDRLREAGVFITALAILFRNAYRRLR